MDVADSTTPRDLGYYWPAEWEPHAATWLSWPHNRDSWPGKFELIPPQFAEFVKTVVRYEPVHVLAGGRAVMEQARLLVGDEPNVSLHDVPTNDAWCRDHGPTFLAHRGGQPAALIDWQYNAWGGKYPPFDADNAVPEKVAAITGRRRFAMNLVLEGGSIENNGAGTILTTEDCVLSGSRNPGISREDVERALVDCLNVKRILWLKTAGFQGDDTDGHIDQLARFVDAKTVVAAVASDPNDPNRDSLAANVAALKEMNNADDHRLEVVPLPTPRPLFCEGHRLPASYCNYYVINGAVIVPAFGEPTDDAARSILADIFPDRDILLLPARDIVWGLGAFHCLSQQEAA